MDKAKKKRIILIAAAGIVIVLAIIFIKSCSTKKQNISIETVKVKTGSVSNTVTATGTIEAIKTVAVGCQVSGEVSKIYVDYNSQVKAGQLLAELDRKQLTTALTISEASFDDAKSEMTYQTANYNRIKSLFDKKLVAESDYDLALYNYERAKTALKTAQLNYDKAKINLSYAYIYSPIDGVVLNRAVDEGQTVAASFSTPTLFSIANDLTRMQVEASIDEADIGQVKNGQRVDFTVDAYPDEKFTGTVIQIRLEPVIASNVVTYTVIVEAPNPDKKLMPGMTASITIYVEEANNVLTVSSKALRFKANQLLMKAYFESLPREQKPDSIPGLSKINRAGSMAGRDALPHGGNMPGDGSMPSQGIMPGDGSMPSQGIMPGDGSMPAQGSIPWSMRGELTSSADGSVNTTGDKNNEVWVKSGNILHPVRIETGIDNDVDVQILSGLKEGDDVIVSMSMDKVVSFDNSEEEASSPFMPKPPSSRTKTKSQSN